MGGMTEEDTILVSSQGEEGTVAVSRIGPAGSVHRSASSMIRSLYDGGNCRRRGLSTTSGSGGAAVLRLPSPGGGAFFFSSILSRRLSILGFAVSPYSNSFGVPCLTYVGRKGTSNTALEAGSSI
jgi:hypothetical protein